jgi:ribosomal protein L6P/L9E
MAKYFKRGNYNLLNTLNLKVNKPSILNPGSKFQKNYYKINTTNDTIKRLIKVGKQTPYVKTLIIRGIGYRAFLLENDFVSKQKALISDSLKNYEPTNNELDPQFWSNLLINENKYSRYLIVRAGHTKDKFISLPIKIKVKTLKKDRKLVIFGLNKQDVSSIAAAINQYRQPSVYTGRGVRYKAVKVLRKAGKTDKQK